MTVGHELERLTGLRLFHNHMTVEPIIRLFDFGTPAYSRLVGEFRRRIFQEVAASDLPGLIFTFVWALDDPRDKAFVDELVKIFTDRGAAVGYVELEAAQGERLRRNEAPSRLVEKPSKRDLPGSRTHLLKAGLKYQLNTRGTFFYPDRHLKIENTAIAPAVVALQIAERFGLPRRAAG